MRAVLGYYAGSHTQILRVAVGLFADCGYSPSRETVAGAIFYKFTEVLDGQGLMIAIPIPSSH